MNAIKNQSMLEDERLNVIDFFEKYSITTDTSIWHIMTKLVDYNVYKVDDVLKKENSVGYKNNVNKVVFDLFELLKNSEMLQNFSDILNNGWKDNFFECDTSFRFNQGIEMVLNNKVKNKEISIFVLIKLLKDFNSYESTYEAYNLEKDMTFKK